MAYSAFIRLIRSSAVFVALAMLASVALPRNSTEAHTELLRSSPSANAVLAAPPERIELWMSEAVASGAGSPDIKVLDESGNALTVQNVRVDPNDSRHIIADIADAGFGTFTVLWTSRSDVDGHTLDGTFAFRVGGTSRAPGAATVEGETPRAWAVAARWLTFLGAAIAAASFLVGPLVLGGVTDDRSRRRRYALVLGGALVGLLATLAEPVLQSRFPPSGLASPSISDAFRALPTAWFLRAPGLAAAALLAALLLVRRRPADAGSWLGYAGAAAALIAILGLALTSHASARETWRAPAVASVIVHQWSVALWTGGLIHLLIARPYDRAGDRPMPIQRFSRYALVLAAAGMATGAINAGLALPALRSLWQSDYGKVIIAKTVILVPALVLATFHRQTLRRAAERAASAFRLTLRLETALVAVVVLGGSTLALLAPPSVAKSDVTSVDLAAPLPNTGGPSGRYVRLVVQPADQGENAIGVAVTEGAPRAFGPEGKLVDSPVVTDIALVRVSLTNLDRATAPSQIELTGDGTGWFRASRIQLGLEGWWRADVLVRQLGVEDAVVPFYLLLPDPNVHGFSAVRIPNSDDVAKQVFESGVTGITELNSVHFVERLAGGTGTVLVSDHITHAGSDSQPAAMRIATESSELIRMNGFQWVRQDGSDWRKTDSSPVVPPSQWGTDYQNATGFHLGGQETIGDRTAQIVTFYVPGDIYAPAWYAWWVDVDNGHVLRETMISVGHYMIRDFDGFDSAPPVTAPTD